MYDFADPDDSNTIRIPFIFVPHGHPLPTEWLRDHPGAFRVPAVFVPRSDDGQPASLDIDMEAFVRSAASEMPSEWPSMEDPSNIVQAKSVRTYPIPGPPALIPDMAETYRLLRRWWAEPEWESHPASPEVMESNPRPDRNAGLPPPLRTYTTRAQKSAEAADALVKQNLRADQQRVHHLINAAAAREFGDVLSAAARTGWFMDEPANVITLPANSEAQQHLAAQGLLLPVHDNPHPNWNIDVRAELLRIRSFADAGLGAQPNGAKDLFIRSEIEQLQKRLRLKAISLPRIVERGPETSRTG
jgi:hypothetical protein